MSRVCGTCDPTASLSPARAQEPMGYAVGGHQGRKVSGFCCRSAPCWGPSLGSEAAPLPAAPTPCASLAGSGREEHASCSANCPSQQLPRGGGHQTGDRDHRSRGHLPTQARPKRPASATSGAMPGEEREPEERSVWRLGCGMGVRWGLGVQRRGVGCGDEGRE